MPLKWLFFANGVSSIRGDRSDKGDQQSQFLAMNGDFSNGSSHND